MTVRVNGVIRNPSAWSLFDATRTTTDELLATLNDMRGETKESDGETIRRGRF